MTLVWTWTPRRPEAVQTSRFDLLRRRNKPRRPWVSRVATNQRDHSVTRRPPHNRIRTGWGQASRQRTAPEGGTSRAGNNARKSADPDPSRPANSAAHYSLSGCVTPPLDIETIARQNALWIHLRGEADLGNHERLHSGLTQVELDGARAVHLVLTDFTFCDVPAFRHLVDFAGRVRAAGRELSAHGACPTIRKVARLLNVDDELHFV